MSRWAWLLVVFCVTAWVSRTPYAEAADANYTVNGPCKYQKIAIGTQKMPFSSTGCKLKECIVKVYVTLPTKAGQSPECQQGPNPVIVFFNAFQTYSISYKAYAARLASFGYAVVQYDTAFGTLIVDKVELEFMPTILSNLKLLASDASNALSGHMDFNMLAVAGHSRGGKLAALQLAKNSTVKTAYLIDPVDNTIVSPESDAYPSAVKALQQADPKKVAGVSGAGVTSLCNPAGSNYMGFYSALGKGSWLEVLPQAPHLAFADTPLAATPVCGKGATTPREAVPITVATVTAWMEQAVRGQAVPAAFRAWMEQKVKEGIMTFTVKN